MKKRILSLVLALTMLAGMCAFTPTSVNADSDSAVYEVKVYSWRYVNLTVSGCTSYRVGAGTNDDTIYASGKCKISVPFHGEGDSTAMSVYSLPKGTNVDGFVDYIWDDAERSYVETPIHDIYWGGEHFAELDEGTYGLSISSGGDGVGLVLVVGSGETPISVFLNDKKLSFDALPVVENDRTLVPVRTIFEALGMEVGWNGELQCVTAEGRGKLMKLCIGSDTAEVDGKACSLDAPAKIIENRTFVPLRFIAESVGATVDWDAVKRVITIDYADKKYLMLKRDTESVTYCEEYDKFFIKPYQYTALEIVDDFGNKVFTNAGYTVESSNNSNVTVDEYLTMSAKSSSGPATLFLKDSLGNTIDTKDVSIVASPLNTKFLVENKNSINALGDKYSYNYWDQAQKEDKIYWAAASVYKFWMNPGVDYFFKDSNYQDLVTTVLTDALISDVAVANMQNELAIESINSLIDQADLYLDFADSLQADYIANLNNHIKELKMQRSKYLNDDGLRDLDPATLAINNTQKMLNGIQWQEEIKEAEMESFILSDMKNNADKLGIGRDLISAFGSGTEAAVTISALASVKDNYIGGLKLCAEQTKNEYVKSAMQSVIETMEQSFCESALQVLTEAGKDFAFSDVIKDTASKTAKKTCEKILKKFGVSESKITSIVAGVGNAANAWEKIEIAAEITTGACELLLGTSTSVEKAYQLRAMMSVLDEVNHVYTEYLSKLTQDVECIDTILDIVSIKKPLMLYSCYLLNKIGNAHENSSWEIVKRYMSDDDLYYDGYDRMYTSEAKKIGNVYFKR